MLNDPNLTKDLQDAMVRDFIKAQLVEIPRDAEGLFVLTVGSEDFMIGGKIIRDAREFMSGYLKENFKNMGVLVVPWYIKLDTINLKELLKDENTQ